jgi:hypothetical protein
LHAEQTEETGSASLLETTGTRADTKFLMDGKLENGMKHSFVLEFHLTLQIHVLVESVATFAVMKYGDIVLF